MISPRARRPPPVGEAAPRQRYDVTTLGELVIDLVPVASPAGPAYLAKPGGAPANVAAGLARLGCRAAMISKVGEEAFGRSAVSALQGTGVSTEHVARTPAHNTAVAVVSLTAEGDADYFFYRDNCADANLTEDDITTGLIGASRVLHVGTLLLARPASAAAQRHAVASAKAQGVLVSADLNFRPRLWGDAASMCEAGMETVRAAALVKSSQAELALLTGLAATAEAVRSLWHPAMIAFAVTEGAAGAHLFTERDAVSVSGFKVDAVDTVGCGDAFMAATLAGLLERDFAPLDRGALQAIGARSCAAGAIMATRSGALEVMPTRAEIDLFLEANR